MSTKLQAAPRTWPNRAAVSTMNSKLSFVNGQSRLGNHDTFDRFLHLGMMQCPLASFGTRVPRQNSSQRAARWVYHAMTSRDREIHDC